MNYLDECLEIIKANSAMIGAKYLHFKGGRYVVKDLAVDASGKGVIVVYSSLGTGVVFTRPLVEWSELTDRWPDNQLLPRFKPYD